MVEMYKDIKVPKHLKLEDVYDYVDTGDMDKAPQDMVDYLDALEKVRDMKRRINRFASKEHIIKHLEKVNGLHWTLANKIYNDAVEYFYLENTIPKEAYRNMYADEQDEDIALARLASKGIDDLERISKMREKAYKFRKLDDPDVDDFPEGLFDKPFKIYTTDPEQVGIIKADRREVAGFIDRLSDLSELQKDILKREAGILPFRAFLDAPDNPRNNEE